MTAVGTTLGPNIVLFVVDQLSAKWLEAARAGVVPTPHFDRLAATGTSFTRCISSNPVCCPARATLATGMTSRQHGLLQNGYELDPSIPTFMGQLQAGGWRTAALGKVHLHPHGKGLHPDYRLYGFDVTHITEDPRGGEWLDWIIAEHPDHLDAALAQIWCPHLPAFADYGPTHLDLRERIRKVRRDFAWHTPEEPDATTQYRSLALPRELSQTEWITGHAERFIAEAPADRPFFAQISYVQPHAPFFPPRDHLDHVARERISEAVPAEWLDDPNAPRLLRQRTPVDWDTPTARRYYFADIAHLDEQLGRIMAALEQREVLDQTCIVFLSDHGEMLGDHGLRGKGGFHYDACTRVPLIIAGPGLDAGRTCEAFVQLEDLAPTVIDLAGLDPPSLPAAGPYLKSDVPVPSLHHGRSLLPLCRGEPPRDWRQSAYVESYSTIHDTDPAYWARTIRTADARYTFYPAGGGDQLFDLSNDPDELHNLAADPGHAELRRDLRDALTDRMVLQDHPHPPRSLVAMGIH